MTKDPIQQTYSQQAMRELSEEFQRNERQEVKAFPVVVDILDGYTREEVKRWIADQAPGVDYRLYLNPEDVGDHIMLHYRARFSNAHKNLAFLCMTRFG